MELDWDWLGINTGVLFGVSTAGQRGQSQWRRTHAFGYLLWLVPPRALCIRFKDRRDAYLTYVYPRVSLRCNHISFAHNVVNDEKLVLLGRIDRSVRV